MRLRTTSPAIGTGSMAASSRADCAPWASGTSPPHQPRLGRAVAANSTFRWSHFAYAFLGGLHHLYMRVCFPTGTTGRMRPRRWIMPRQRNSLSARPCSQTRMDSRSRSDSAEVDLLGGPEGLGCSNKPRKVRRCMLRAWRERSHPTLEREDVP